MDVGLGQHGVVLQLRLSQDWSVGSNNDQLGLTLSQRLDNGLVPEGVLTGLDDKGKLLVDVLLGLWGLQGVLVSCSTLFPVE